MRKLSKLWPALLALVLFISGGDQILGQNAKRNQKNAKKQMPGKVKPQTTTTIEAPNPEVVEAQNFLSLGVARIDAALECVC